MNVRALPSTKASLVRQISSASTEVIITSDVTNSAGERWYGVRLYSGYVGYIRSDLLRVELDKTEAVAVAVPTSTVASKTAGKSHKVIYVIVEPVEEEEKEEEPEIIYLTPEQAAEMGLLDGTTLSDRDDTKTEEEPVNG